MNYLCCKFHAVVPVETNCIGYKMDLLLIIKVELVIVVLSRGVFTMAKVLGFHQPLENSLSMPKLRQMTD